MVRPPGGALAVAVFGALVADRGEFIVGLRVALCVDVVMLVATTAAALMLPRGRVSARRRLGRAIAAR